MFLCAYVSKSGQRCQRLGRGPLCCFHRDAQPTTRCRQYYGKSGEVYHCEHYTTSPSGLCYRHARTARTTAKRRARRLSFVAGRRSDLPLTDAEFLEVAGLDE